MIDAYAEIRDRLSHDISAAWEFDQENLIWVVNQAQVPETYPSAVVQRLPSCPITPLGPTKDLLKLSFKVAGRWKVEPDVDEDLFSFEMVSRLRARLVYPHYTQYGHAPMVESVEYVEADSGDKFVEAQLLFSVGVVVDRSTDSDGVNPHTPRYTGGTPI